MEKIVDKTGEMVNTNNCQDSQNNQDSQFMVNNNSSNNSNNSNNNKMNPPDLSKAWQYQINCPTAEIVKIVEDYLISLGLKGGICDKGYYKCICISFKENKFSANSQLNGCLGGDFGKEISFNHLFSPEFVNYYKNSQVPKYVEVVLNEARTVKVYKDKVIYGCGCGYQEFPADIGQKLVDAQKSLT